MKYKFLSGQKCDNFFLKINFGNYIGSPLQEVLDWQRCVELWYGAVWDLVSREEAILTAHKQWSF